VIARGRTGGLRDALAGSLALALLLGSAASAPGAAAAEPTRVATLLPFVEDALRREAPDSAAVVVATVRRSLHQSPPEELADLGSAHSPSLESLARARADLVVGDAVLHAGLREELARVAGEVLLLRTDGVEATLGALEEVGRRVGAAEELSRAADATRERIARLALERPVPVLALFGAPGTFYALTSRTWLGDLLARLGFENAVDAGTGEERFPGIVALSDEVMATLRPELVLLVAHGDREKIQGAFESRIGSGGPWAGLGRSAHRGLHVLEPRLFAANPGLAMDEAARRLVELAGGEARRATAALRPVASDGAGVAAGARRRVPAVAVAEEGAP